jgi:biopolymer transport protein ExbD
LANWDVFHGDRLELERGLTTRAVREALARGDLRDDDLVRPSGTTVAWARLADMPQLLETDEPPPNLHTTPPVVIASSPASANASVAAPGVRDVPTEGSGLSRVLPPAQEPARREPDSFELRPEADDLTFPVINDESSAPRQAQAASKNPDVAPSGQWDWPADDDEDDIEEDDADFESGAGFDEDLVADDLEILDDETVDGGDVPFALVDEPEKPDANLSKLSTRDDAGFALVDEPEKLDTSSHLALPVASLSELDNAGALAEVPEEDEFSLSRSGPMTVEELDLAPMVDVAFQLVLFFMVAAQTVLYKTLEIPKPSAEQAPAAVAQGRSRTLDELKEDYILVEIDGSGTMKIDREPVAADAQALVERLRSAREATHRKSMLLSAEYATSHRNAVLAYDAANEIGLGIVIARPSTPQGPAPGLLPARPAAPAPAPGQPTAPPSAVPN